MTSTTAQEHVTTARIEADPTIPGMWFVRDFRGAWSSCSGPTPTPSCSCAGTVRTAWRPTSRSWDARTGGEWRYVTSDERGSYAFHGCFHEVRQDRIVQTFTFDGYPDGVALETITFTDLGDGRTRLEALSLCDSFEGRDMMLASGMEVGVHEGYAKLDGLLARALTRGVAVDSVVRRRTSVQALGYALRRPRYDYPLTSYRVTADTIAASS